MLTRRLRAIVLFLVVTLAANPAWAVQAHGGTEGLVSHQIGHILFATGLGYLLFRLRNMRQTGSGWFEFKTFIWLLIAWNVTTFSGHWMNEFIGKDKFIMDHANTLFFKVESLPDAIYYLTRLDHFILVPSFVFLLIALRKREMAK